MKKYNIVLSVLAAVSFSACTLYMDEPEDAARILRTGEGYDEEESITLPNGEGEVTYKYSQKTIPIDDEVEQYIAKVENDTILYFKENTPDDLLPVEGEMMTCSFRDLFPNGFCHKCIQRTEQNGQYRCTFTKCEYSEAFDKLKFEVSSPTEVILPEGAEFISQEEMDSIMNTMEADADDEPAATRGNTRASVRKELTPIRLGIPDLTLSPNFMGQGISSITINAMIHLGGYFDVSYDTDTKEFYEEYGLHGDVDVSAEISGSLGVRFESPVAIPLLGLKFDLIVVGLDMGLTISPYFEVKEESKMKVQFTHGTDIALAYIRTDGGKGELSFTKNKVKKKKGKPVINFTSTSESSNSGLSLHLIRGNVLNIGLGGDVFGIGADISLGADVYADYKLYADLNQYQSPEDLKQSFQNVPAYTKGYFQASVGAFGFALPVSINTNPIRTGTWNVPILPVYRSGTGVMYCSDFNPRTYYMGFELEDPGLLCSYWGGTPVMKVYYDGGTQGEALETFELPWEKGGYLTSAYAKKKSNELMNNMEYIAQPGVTVHLPRFKYNMPLIDLPFVTEVPDMILESSDLRLVQSLTPQNATPAELANPTIINRSGDRVGWVKNGKLYACRYKIDVPVYLEGLRLIRRWGVRLNDNYAASSEFSHKEKSKDLSKEYVLRMTWYSNESSMYLGFSPWVETQDAHGNKGGKITYKSVGGTFEYTQFLDKQLSITDKGPDFEKSRDMMPKAIWNIPDSGLPVGEGAVLGEVEILE